MKSYLRYNISEEVTGFGYRDEYHGKAIAISIVLPILLILLTFLFEKPIVSKLENLNS